MNSDDCGRRDGVKAVVGGDGGGVSADHRAGVLTTVSLPN
jgi:hypothetical protein